MGTWQKVVWIVRERRWALGMRLLLLLLRLPLELKRRPLSEVLRRLRAPSRVHPRYSQETVVRLSGALVQRLPHTRGSPCLYRSLLLFRYLPEAGAMPTIHFGVSKTGGTIVAHSWITVNREPIADPSQPTPASYRELYSFPSTPA